MMLSEVLCSILALYAAFESRGSHSHIFTQYMIAGHDNTRHDLPRALIQACTVSSRQERLLPPASLPNIPPLISAKSRAFCSVCPLIEHGGLLQPLLLMPTPEQLRSHTYVLILAEPRSGYYPRWLALTPPDNFQHSPLRKS